jgi:hypothetical protein
VSRICCKEFYLKYRVVRLACVQLQVSIRRTCLKEHATKRGVMRMSITQEDRQIDVLDSVRIFFDIRAHQIVNYLASATQV